LVVAALVAASCVNLSYPPGASRDGGGQALVAHLGNGRACTMNADCASGHCADSVCCKTECSDTCFTCALVGNEGVCMPAPVGMDPRGSCVDEGVATCGHNGVCDGAGACQKYAVGTICKDAMCLSPHEDMLASRCSADGVCVAGQPQKCAPYLCDIGSKCLTSCTDDRDCENGVKCVAGSCGKKALGTACAMDSDCDSMVCAQGVCCAGACAGGCLSCALPGSEGACTAVTSGAKPADGSCATTDASTCGLDGACDGAGHCRNYPAGTACTPAACSTATLRAAGLCDGKAHCQVPAPATCGGFTCASPTACRTTCATDIDCQAPSVCCTMPAICGSPSCGGLTAQYFRQTNLTDLAFTRTDPTINFNWGGGAPPGPVALSVDAFSIRWRGKLTARFDEDYTFFAQTDDGERLWVNNVLLINRFVRKPSIPEDVSIMPIRLKPGQPVDIVLEYFESGGDASAVLFWQSTSEPKAVIPTSALSPQ
jgi:hypothetical protein